VVVAFLLSPVGRDLVRLLMVWLRLRLRF
jgi:hypothetical protein